ncbi:helix-turn-helix transcriptional regulator [Janthinobacterium sp. SUN100]|uniref:helix-turn-helix domain-containing protein n=1 Tax=Janthinobacterium sp. SUN100 TaxID=3004101 RepID=UPI0025AFE61F|nr:helix-turn-helix transcriptional regulator [Janthinobacterium sp. SUN100]MDN2700853.1 helix-turn-helix transcriptional regulator [Janthinobacterium sp. SUN100]
MKYSDLIEMALKGRSVNSMARTWGVPQPTLARYMQGNRLPDYDLALKIAIEAGVEPGEAFIALAEEQRNLKSKNFKLQGGFVQIIPLLSMAIGTATMLVLYIM